MFGYIYETINLINHKKYIGRHIANTFDINYKGSGKILLQAIEKEGWDNFECHILEPINNINTVCESLEELCNSEEYYINYYDCVKSKDYYNLIPGGKGNSCSGVIYIRSKTGKCKKVFQEELDYYFSLGYIKGGPIPTKEAKEKRSKSLKLVSHSEEWGLKISNSLKGIPKSEEHVKHVSEALKGRKVWNSKKVLCVETGIVYDSLHKAAKAIGGKSPGSLLNTLKANKTYLGYHWKYI